jgi:hypothetical protein
MTSWKRIYKDKQRRIVIPPEVCEKEGLELGDTILISVKKLKVT